MSGSTLWGAGKCASTVIPSATAYIVHLQLLLHDLQRENETLTVQTNSCTHQLQSVQNQTKKLHTSQDTLRQQIQILSKSLDRAEDEAKKAEALVASLTKQQQVLGASCLVWWIMLAEWLTCEVFVLYFNCFDASLPLWFGVQIREYGTHQ